MELPIFHLHGICSDPDSILVITDSDYNRFHLKRKMLFERLKLEFASSTFLYIGYSNEDRNWNQLLDETIQEFNPSKLPHSYRINPYSDGIVIDILKSKNIETLKMDFLTFKNAAEADVVNPSALDRSKKDSQLRFLPSALKNKLDTEFVPMSRLLKSWEFVSAANFSEASNFEGFIKGDKANWGLVAQKEYFVRDIEQDLIDSILDFATTHHNISVFSLILAPAGYGISTLLMILASKIALDGIGTALVLKPGKPILIGDIEYASKLDENVFFICDDSAQNSAQLTDVSQYCREKKIRCTFLLGDRINKWKQKSTKPKCIEYIIEPLTDAEILRLLDY